jgi:hypothetical protein
MWRFTTMVIRHYMHMVKMKRHKFLKNKVVERIVKANVEKVSKSSIASAIILTMTKYG